MTPFVRARRERWGNALLTAALLLPLVLVVAILVHTRSAERAQRELADRALAHYAAVAAWQLAARIDAEYHARIEMLVRPLVRGGSAEHMRSPDPGGMADCDCADSVATRVAFRYGAIPDSLEILRGTPDSGTRALLERIARRTQAATGGEPHRVAFDSAGGTVRAVSMFVGAGGAAGAGTSRVVHGAEGDPAGYERVVAAVLANHAVLPPQLLRPPYTARQLAVRVSDTSGFVVFANEGRFAAAAAARDSVPRYPHLRVDVEIAPAVAEALIIGGLPPTRAPALLGLLGIASLLAAAALVQHRRARELNRMRTQFIASVSHELRTPLTQISMFGETLKLGRERSESERRQFASIIHRESIRLSALVDNVLRYTRGGADRFALQPSVRNVADEIDQAVAAFRPIADAASARIELRLDRSVHARIDADAMRQVVLNLLDNAVKYGPAGQRIEVALRRDEGFAVLTIADEGPGVRDADRERIFEPFIRLEGAPRNVAGTGIGLAVVRELVTALGGTVAAQSGASGGAAFTVRVPAVDVPEAQ